MFRPIENFINNKNNIYNDRRWWLGLALVSILTIFSIDLSHVEVLKNAQLSSLTVGIVLGIIVGNTIFSRIATQTDVGVDFAKSILLKAGVILFGFRWIS